jgi:acetyl-CoA carboxylase carboxyl transferase subunit alpha
VKTSFLDFEQPIAELEQKIEELRFVQDDMRSTSPRRSPASKKAASSPRNSGSSPRGRFKVARHPQRPYTLDYVNTIHGFRGDTAIAFADDPRSWAGRSLNGQSVMVIGHQKARHQRQDHAQLRMPRPEGYRRAAPHEPRGKVRIPLLTFIDTPVPTGHRRRGARPVGSYREEPVRDGGLRIPVVVSVIGEGGSGGALASRWATSR